jgi:hypothetical protein
VNASRVKDARHRQQQQDEQCCHRPNRRAVVVVFHASLRRHWHLQNVRARPVSIPETGQVVYVGHFMRCHRQRESSESRIDGKKVDYRKITSGVVPLD